MTIAQANTTWSDPKGNVHRIRRGNEIPAEALCDSSCRAECADHITNPKVLQAPEGATQAVPDFGEGPLVQRKRGQLDALAHELGLSDTDKLGTKDDVIGAIEEHIDPDKLAEYGA